MSGRLGLLALSALCATSSAAAHDFWVQPSEYWVIPRAITSVTLQVGHGSSRQRSPIPRHRIIRFEAITPAGTIVDMRDSLSLGGASSDGVFRFEERGAHLLVLETDDQARSRLPASRFNSYLVEEGLTPALEQRRRLQRMDADGSEQYSRQTKALVQVGAPGAGLQAQATRPVGLRLEIVPEIDPYADPQSAMLPVRVLFDGRPLAGALVKLTNLEHDAAPLETQRTDDAGRASFTMPKRGNWLLNVIWTKPLTNSREADFETLFSSLSFGLPPAAPR